MENQPQNPEFAMTIAADLGRKATKQTKKLNSGIILKTFTHV